MNIPKASSYGPYGSGNYGAHCTQLSVGPIMIYYSYSTPVAFKVPGLPRIVRQNDWKQTTGKHLNAIDDGDKKNRVDGETFMRLFEHYVVKPLEAVEIPTAEPLPELKLKSPEDHYEALLGYLQQKRMVG